MAKKVVLKIDEVRSPTGSVMGIEDTLTRTTDLETRSTDLETRSTDLETKTAGFANAGNLTVFSEALRLDKPMRSQAALTAGNIDLAESNYFVCNVTADTTFSFSNIPTDADVVSVVLQLHDAGSFALTWPAEVQWGGGAAPVFTAGASDLVGFITLDRGNNWRGMGLNFNAAVPFIDPS